MGRCGADRGERGRRRAGLTCALRRFADTLLAVLLAPSCAACADALDAPTRGPVCARCWNAIIPIAPPVCQTCGDPLSSWRTDGLDTPRCPRCRRRAGPITRGRAIGAYDGTLRTIIHALKYHGRRSVAPALALMLAVHGATVLAGADVAVPVPLHRSRKRARGFNQAAEIARHLPLPMKDLLRRVRATPSQTDLPAAQRHANVRHAFAIRGTARLHNCVVVLVDDVSTTGATLEACARVLRDAGAREVRALTIARVVSRRP